MSLHRPKENKYEEELKKTAKSLVAPGKGILAADESTGTIAKRLKDINVENTLENRVAYRKALFSTKNLSENISGAILFDETARNKELVKLLENQNIIRGIKVDRGTRKMALSEDFFTQGLDELDVRCKEYYELGCRFAKWRAVLKIEDSMISQHSIDENARTLARYAATCQENGLVPIVEPEILMDGNHCVGQCRRATKRVLAAVFKELSDQNVLLEGMILKTNMCLPGNDYKGEKSIKRNAQATYQALLETLPAAVPGVTFLSGGQSEKEATEHLNEINKINPRPWALTFSFGRALQKSALQAWKGKKENVDAMQKALLARAKANGEASLGKYAGGDTGSAESLHVKGYVY